MSTVYFTDEGYMYSKIEDEDTCPHGLSMWLCAHPIYHYPTDEMMMNGYY